MYHGDDITPAQTANNSISNNIFSIQGRSSCSTEVVAAKKKMPLCVHEYELALDVTRLCYECLCIFVGAPFYKW